MSLEKDKKAEPARTEQEPILETKGLKKHFDESADFIQRLFDRGDTVRAVDGVDLSVRPGETIAVVGESGCGKSTLGKTILNLHEPTEGSVEYQGVDLTSLSESELRSYRTEMQMIFQDPLASLNPRKRVGEILLAPLEVHGIGEDKEERERLAKEMLERVGLKSEHFQRYPNAFSGGQQQRIGIARALMLEPDLLIADEPTSALDVSVQAQILNLLEELQDEFGLSIVFITHDLSVVRYIADRVAVMYLGEFVEVAPNDRLFENPKHPYTQSLLSAVPRIETGKAADRIILEGTVPSPIDPPSGCRFHTRCPHLIPGEDWPGNQKQLRTVYTFYDRIERGDIRVGNITQRLKAQDNPADEDAVVDYLLAKTYDGNEDALPSSVREAVEQAAREYVNDDVDDALATLDEVISTPCTDKPALVNIDETGSHSVTCQLYDSHSPGDESHIEGADRI
jgi:peptide/nickel transport system ATP-binding protein